jgi:hypothetical protein
MAFDSTSAIQDWRQLIEINLTGKTVRYSRDPVTLTDGTYYDDRLIGISSMTLSAGQLLDPRFTLPSLSMVLDNADGTISTLLDGYTFANRTVTVKVGQGTTASDYDTVFVGSVVFPSGIQMDETQVTIDADDDRMKDQKVLPANNFFKTTYANVETKSENLAIPIVYGDWRTSAGGGEKVPCYCINTSTKTFKIASHAIKQIEAVYKDGSAITPSSTDLTNAEFVISDAYDPDVNTITANIQGATHNGSSSGTLLETLPDITNDILQTHLSVSSGSIDSAAFTAWGDNLETVKARRHISAEISSNTLISEALIEGFADLIIDGGKYTPRFRILGTSGIDQYRDFDLTDKSKGTKEFSVQNDPQRVTLNQVVSNYRYDPSQGKYIQRFDAEDSASIADLETTRRRRLNFNWLYLDTDAQTRATRELLAFSTEVEMVEVGVGPRSLTKKPMDQFRLQFNKFVDGSGESGFGTPFQVRDITIDFGKMNSVIRAWNINTLVSGRWTTATAPNWTSSTHGQRLDQGFWTDNNGFADPSGSPDASSKRSRWF